MEMRFQNLPLKPFAVVEPSKHLPTQHSNSVNDEQIVGFENEAEKIIQYLIRGKNEQGTAKPEHLHYELLLPAHIREQARNTCYKRNFLLYLRKMAENDIDDVLDYLRRIKSGDDVNNVKIDQIEILEMELRFLRTFLKYHHVLRPDSLVKIIEKAKLIVEVLVYGGIPDECRTNINLERLVAHLREFIEGNTSSTLNSELDDFYLLEFMDYLDKNLNDALRYLVKADPFLIKEIKILQKKMRFLRYLYGTEINGYVDHDKLKGLQTRIQFMAENVGHFCLAVWVNDDEDCADSKEDEDDTDLKEEGDDTFNIEKLECCEDFISASEDENDKDEDEEDISNKPPYLLCLIVLVELEMKKIFLGELKASKYTKSRTFKDKKLPNGFTHHLHSLLMYLRQKKLKNFVSARDIDVAIEFLLIFLGDVPNHVINGKRLNEVLAKIGVLVGDILCVIQMLLEGSTTKEDASKIDRGTIQILEKIEDLKSQVGERYKSLKYSPSLFPTVGGLTFLDSLLRKLKGMLKSETSSDFMMKPHIRILEKELSYLTFVFRDVVKVQHKHDELLKDLQRCTVNLAYEAEVSIDSILVHYNALWNLFCSLPALTKEIKHIRAEVMETRFQNLPLRPFSVVDPSKHLPTQHSHPVNDEEIVGFENDIEIIIKHLTRGTDELDVIPIVGMGGQGKTTIARKVYNNEQIVSHFHCLAWCCISQTYNRIVLLKDIFSQVASSKDDVAKAKDDKLADMLRKSLMNKRYLIVLDDMWDVSAWEDLMLSFPNGKKSRIIITTRLENVGKQVKYHTDTYYLPFLTLDESCKLLQKKVFQQEGCPPELQYLSLQIAEKCKGLPLVIILVAGIIKRKKMDASWWHEVKNSLLSYLGESEGYSLSTMQLSYDNLPEHLRPCLLYMGMFPEDARIPVSKLISLWIAEGFVQNTESGRLMEEEAEGYLMDLIQSNMVMVSKRRYNGKVKYFQVHDVVLHFCLEKSREENFALAVKGDFQPLDWKGSRVIYTTELSKFANLGSKTRKPFNQHLRSLITTNKGDFYDWNPFCLVSEVRLLKVLDLSSHNVGCLSSTTLKPLIHLKYLSVCTGDFNFHPDLHLPRLETLIVDGITKFPAIFWKMEELRHVEISRATFDLENNKQQNFAESSNLDNLKILRNVNVPIDEADKVNVLSRRCPNLQQLDIFFRYYHGSVVTRPKLEGLTQLQSLSLSFEWPLFLTGLQLHSNLTKLVLRGTRIESVISFIAGLPNLEYLRLCDSFNYQKDDHLGEQDVLSHIRVWCLGDIILHKLKFLKLELDITRWDASEESFPLLETLIIIQCDKLKGIPLSFADIPTLKQIKLIRCNNASLEASAVEIKEEVEAIQGCDRIDLIINDKTFIDLNATRGVHHSTRFNFTGSYFSYYQSISQHLVAGRLNSCSLRGFKEREGGRLFTFSIIFWRSRARIETIFGAITLISKGD
ncbi:hypothetical protein HAX54_053282 [Datura stramonium]|uniref:Late blight resistance protein homolog R1A-3 n=1 Tax=Datura stramonium TaxID=4076 RepID=A0ABS8T149_DATST|nr:hypothetical protein [Datura stramonium]